MVLFGVRSFDFHALLTILSRTERIDGACSTGNSWDVAVLMLDAGLSEGCSGKLYRIQVVFSVLEYESFLRGCSEENACTHLDPQSADLRARATKQLTVVPTPDRDLY